jgi:hypothetical protein
MSNMTVNAVPSGPSSQEKALAPMDSVVLVKGPPQSMKRARFLINDILSSDKEETDISEHERGFSPGNPPSELPKDLSFHRRSTCGDSSDYDDSESIKGQSVSIAIKQYKLYLIIK